MPAGFQKESNTTLTEWPPLKVHLSPQKHVLIVFIRLELLRQFISASITKTCLFKYTENFTTKNENFQTKYSDIFHISAQNVDCGYSLEPPRRDGSNEYPQSMF